MPEPPRSFLVVAMAIPDVEYIVPPPGAETVPYASSASPASPPSPMVFKKHRTLPRPRNGSANGSILGTPDSTRSGSLGSQRYPHNQLPLADFVLCANGAGSHVASLHTLRHQRRRLSGVELPPTPPAHSRNSSSSHSVTLSNLGPLQTPDQSSEDVQSKTNPSTPPNQRSPPTPEVTPPRTEARHKAVTSRPSLSQRIPSKSTTRTDSRTESFRTALESPEPSDEEDSRSTLRPAPPSTRTSQITVRQLDGCDNKSQSGSRIGSSAELDCPEDLNDLTPTTKSEFNSFDGEWAFGNEVEQEWDDNLARNVTVNKSRPRTHANGRAHEAAKDETVSPTNATKAVRAFPLQGRILTYDSREPRRRSVTAPEAAYTEAPTNGDARRLSGMSSRSTASTVVEAILVETPPPRHKTLRHVRRVDALRDSIWQPTSSPHSSAPSLQENGSRRRHASRPTDAPRESHASNSTVNSVSSRRARREVTKSGGIPVAVIPDRQSSNRSNSQERSLRSASSQRSKRSHSVTSVPPPQIPSDHELTSYFDRPPRRGRRPSESDGSVPGDQRTIDFPPTIPRRSSSLSASTGRNGSREASRHGSRAGSLTAESLKAHNESTLNRSAVQASGHEADFPSGSPTGSSVPVVTPESAPSSNQVNNPGKEPDETEDDRRKTFDTVLGSPRFSTLATPFSVASVDTNMTAAEISEAMAVRIMPHQNRSLLMVNHRPSESSDGDRESQSTERQGQPTITTDEVCETSEEEPVTPQAEYPFFLSNVDSPLRNPRAPPEPPVLQFIPATPSGLTPAEEKPRLLGNFYEETGPDEKPARGLAMVKRALTKRRDSYGPSPSRDTRPGFLTRKLSLSKNLRKGAAENSEVDQDGDEFYDDEPRDDSRLYPDWRPSHHLGYDGDDDDHDVENGGELIMRYPLIDNRPRPPKRSLSQRMKRTFAIMPLKDDDDEYMHNNETEKLTMRRTPSGNHLRPVQRSSVGSSRNQQDRTDTAPEMRRGPIFTRPYRYIKRRRSDRDSDSESQHHGLRRTWSLTQSVHDIPRRISEKRREKRSNELRQKISGPRDVRDGVDDVIRRDGLRGTYQHHHHHQPRSSGNVERF